MLLLLFITGFLPLLCGIALNWYMVTYPNTLPPLFLIGIIFLLLWGFLGFLFRGKGNSTKEVLLMTNAIAAIDLLLVGIQELIFRAYWMNIIGILTQFYYLPVLKVGDGLTNWSHSIFLAYVAGFLLMVGVSFAGCKIREKMDR